MNIGKMRFLLLSFSSSSYQPHTHTHTHTHTQLFHIVRTQYTEHLLAETTKGSTDKARQGVAKWYSVHVLSATRSGVLHSEVPSWNFRVSTCGLI